MIFIGLREINKGLYIRMRWEKNRLLEALKFCLSALGEARGSQPHKIPKEPSERSAPIQESKAEFHRAFARKQSAVERHACQFLFGKEKSSMLGKKVLKSFVYCQTKIYKSKCCCSEVFHLKS